MWNTFLDFSFGFSMAFALLKRGLTFFAMIILEFSYCRACKPYAEKFDKLLRALMASDLKN